MSSTAVHIVVNVGIPSEKADEIFQVGQSLVAHSVQEEGNDYYSFVKAENSDGAVTDDYYIIERYKDQDAVEFHFKTEYFLTLVPQLVEKGMTIKFLKQADDKSTGKRLSPASAVDHGGNALRFIVSVFVSDENVFISLAQQLTDKSREEDGCLGYTFAKVKESAENEYYFVELWTNEAALAAHALTPHYLEIVPQLTTCMTPNNVMKAFINL